MAQSVVFVSPNGKPNDFLLDKPAFKSFRRRLRDILRERFAAFVPRFSSRTEVKQLTDDDPIQVNPLCLYVLRFPAVGERTIPIAHDGAGELICKFRIPDNVTLSDVKEKLRGLVGRDTRLRLPEDFFLGLRGNVIDDQLHVAKIGLRMRDVLTVIPAGEVHLHLFIRGRRDTSPVLDTTVIVPKNIQTHDDLALLLFSATGYRVIAEEFPIHGTPITTLDKKGPQLPMCDFVTILLLANYLAKVSS
jgi:hypothetical protein